MRDIGFGLALLLGYGAAMAHAQNAPATERPGAESTQTFYLTNVASPDDGNQIFNAVRFMLPQHDVVTFYDSSLEAIVVHATQEQLALAQKLINDLDRPRKAYRLTYTLTEMDAGKRVGTPQHYALVLTAGQRTMVHLGSKVPVASGYYSSGGANGISTGAGVQTQFSYVDVGISFDATLDEVAGGARLKSKVDQSSVAPESSDAEAAHQPGMPQQPVVRQATVEGMSMLTLGKPLMLGSLDIPGSTAHMDVEVVMEAVK